MARVNGSDQDGLLSLSLYPPDFIHEDLGDGYDFVDVYRLYGRNDVRLTFSSAEVGNGSAYNGGGAPAVSLMLEDEAGQVGGSAESRLDDEGISFVNDGSFLFDVRDGTSGGAGLFNVVRLGTQGNDYYRETKPGLAAYINGGKGNDTIFGGTADDFLVGGLGKDRLVGGLGDDTLIGSAGNDVIIGGNGDDRAIFNVSTDGSDSVDLGKGDDRVNVAVAARTSQVRLTFTSAEVGNNDANDSGTLANQDGDLAVRLQTEDALGDLGGAVSRFDDEGMTFVSTTAGVTFDVRDLVSGTARGDQFSAVALGTGARDLLDFSAEERSVYANGGVGNDRVFGGADDDFLVGGAGNDILVGGAGSDTLLGGAGADQFILRPGAGSDTIVDFQSGTDQINLRWFEIDLVDITVATSGTDTVLGVDADGDTLADFTITLLNAAAPVASDFVL